MNARGPCFEVIDTKSIPRDEEKPMLMGDGRVLTATKVFTERSSANSGIALMAIDKGERFEVFFAMGRSMVRFMTAEELAKPKYLGRDDLRVGQNVICSVEDVGVWIYQHVAKSMDRDDILDRLAFRDARLRHLMAELRRKEEAKRLQDE